MKKLVLLSIFLLFFGISGCGQKLVLYNGNEVHEATMKSIEKTKNKFKEDAVNDCSALLNYEDWYYKYFDLIDKSYKVSKDDFTNILGKAKENTVNYREMFFKAMYENYKTTITNERIDILNSMVIDTSNMTEEEADEILMKFEIILEEGEKCDDYDEWYNKHKDILDLQLAKPIRKKCLEHIEDENFDIVKYISEYPKDIWERLKDIQKRKEELEELKRKQEELEKK